MNKASRNRLIEYTTWILANIKSVINYSCHCFTLLWHMDIYFQRNSTIAKDAVMRPIMGELELDVVFRAPS